VAVLGKRCADSNWMVLHVNKGKTIRIGNDTIQSKGIYIICRYEDDNICKDDAYIVSSKMFKKMFQINGKLDIQGIERIREKINKKRSIRIELKKAEINRDSRDEILNAGYEEIHGTGEYTVINIVMQDEDIIGYVLESDDGHNINIDDDKMHKFVSEGKVRNVSIKDVNGKKQVYGAGLDEVVVIKR
jgi:hypothetical protein